MSTGNPDSLGGLPASEYAAIGVQASLYRLAYWASADSLGSTSAVSQAQNGDAITISDSLVVNGRSVLTLIQATGISADSTGLARGTLYIRPSEGIIRWKY
jgi:hypothetical protein